MCFRGIRWWITIHQNVNIHYSPGTEEGYHDSTGIWALQNLVLHWKPTSTNGKWEISSGNRIPHKPSSWQCISSESLYNVGSPALFKCNDSPLTWFFHPRAEIKRPFITQNVLQNLWTCGVYANWLLYIPNCMSQGLFEH